jgi:hypothetical protein
MSPWRASNLAAGLGPAWDGDWWLDDVDVAIFTLPTLDNLKDSDAAMRVLTAAYAQHISSRRREARRPSMLLFDEFGSLAGGRALAINIVERARSSGAGVLLSAQSAAGLGSEPERERLPAASSAVVLFRSPMPAELAALAGSERTPEGAWSFPGGIDVPPDQVTVTERHGARLNQDQVRAARVGEAQIIAAGRVERTRIIQTAIPAETHSHVEALLSHGPYRLLEASRGDSQAPDERRTPAPPRRAPVDNQPGGPGPAAGAVRLAGLTAPPIAGALQPSTPGRALDRREVPPPVQPGQGSAPPAPPPGP